MHLDRMIFFYLDFTKLLDPLIMSATSVRGNIWIQRVDHTDQQTASCCQQTLILRVKKKLLFCAGKVA